MESLRRLDNRLLREGDKDRAAVRAARYLPWMLVLAFLTHFAAVLTGALFLDGLVSGLLVAAAVAAFSSCSARSGDRPG
jgi:hypothetical protein